MSDIVLSIWDFFWIWWIVVLMGGSAYLKAHSLLASAEFHGASDKIVIMSIPDDAAAREFDRSMEYQGIAVDRKAGADAVVILARGVGQAA